MIKIVKGTKEDLPVLAGLMDQYRIFYKQESDVARTAAFLKDRIMNKESIVFLAFYGDDPVGFTQLYTTFSSVSLQPIFILNDLYVKQAFRKKGIGKQLLNRAKEYCLEKGYKGLALETAKDNTAQHLYERLGWKKDTQHFHYFWQAEQ